MRVERVGEYASAGTADGRAPRIPLVRFRRFVWKDLGADRRAALLDDVFAIIDEHFECARREATERAIFPGPETRLAMLEAADGTVGGFATCNVKVVEVDGRPHAVYSAAGFVRTRYRGGAIGAMFALGELLRFRLRHPRMPASYLGVMLGPMSYQRFATYFARVYPRPGVAFPPDAVRVARAAAALRGLEAAGDPPWIIDVGMRSRRAIDPHGRWGRDPHVQAFRAMNPGNADGKALLGWVPLDRANLAGAVRRLARELAGARLRP